MVVLYGLQCYAEFLCKFRLILAVLCKLSIHAMLTQADSLLQDTSGIRLLVAVSDGCCSVVIRCILICNAVSDAPAMRQGGADLFP